MKYHETEIRVRFNEVDEYGIVWYGHYLEWFEIGRLDFMRRFNLSIAKLRKLGYKVPVFKVNCEYKSPARNDDVIIIRTTLIKNEKPILEFKYEIIRKIDHCVLALGETSQVILDKNENLVYVIPKEIEQRVNNMMKYLE